MRKFRLGIPSLVILLFSITAQSQAPLGKLSVEKIMRDPIWMGSSPSSLQWSANGRQLFFEWNPDKSAGDSSYYISPELLKPIKASFQEDQSFLSRNSIRYNNTLTSYTYNKNGDIFLVDLKAGKTKQITKTIDTESNPSFSFGNSSIVFNRNQNLYSWDIATGETIQLTNIRTGASGEGRSTNSTGRSSQAGNQQEEWLKKDQLQYFDVLRTRKEKREETEAYRKKTRPEEMRSIPLEDKILQGLAISPDGRYVTYSLTKSPSNVKTTIVPSYVTETGFTTDIPGRPKVGAAQSSSESFIYDRQRDTIYRLTADSIPGIRDLPDYVKDYPVQLEERKKKNAVRPVSFFLTSWSPSGTYVVYDIRSDDNKDRWLMRWDTAAKKLVLLSRQRDEAWIGGPGIFGSTGWINEYTFYYQSEETGYSHLYTVDLRTDTKKALSTGNYEVQQARLSNDKKSFFISTNEVHPGEQHYYRLTIADGKKTRLTNMPGSNQVSLSPDEKWLAILHSSSNQPWELYMQENKPGGKILQITDKAKSEEFKSYAWREPEVISFPASDGKMVYARVYVPSNPDPNKPAVLFVHGAGYLQNAHKWWSSYFREYMFNNLLADNGYYVMDIDYRGSAGYGRDWRTGIYRHMGGKDLSDHVDAVNYLVRKYGVNPDRVGLYGGSYGGFISLMALFNEPETFAAGAALRPVTDWANYNHGYTSNILNEPYTDSIAYRKSSPYYFADGLKGNLLICHGMVDVNVHYQDAVKLAQRLIELGKDNWELASYPMEDHGFVEPSSWTDEYKRIFKLFENTLKK